MLEIEEIAVGRAGLSTAKTRLLLAERAEAFRDVRGHVGSGLEGACNCDSGGRTFDVRGHHAGSRKARFRGDALHVCDSYGPGQVLPHVRLS